MHSELKPGEGKLIVYIPEAICINGVPSCNVSVCVCVWYTLPGKISTQECSHFGRARIGQIGNYLLLAVHPYYKNQARDLTGKC
jgi:hypothetical protein